MGMRRWLHLGSYDGARNSPLWSVPKAGCAQSKGFPEAAEEYLSCPQFQDYQKLEPVGAESLQHVTHVTTLFLSHTNSAQHS